MIRIRKPEQDDAVLFKMIAGRLLPYARKARPDVQFRRSEVKSRWKSCQVYVWVQAGGKPQGFISCKLQGEVLTIDMLAVERRAEGRGVGSALIAAAEAYGRRKGGATARLAVDEPNTHAQTFYMRKGYAAENYLPEHKMYIMSKRL